MRLRLVSGEYYDQKMINSKIKKWKQVGPVVRKGTNPPVKVSTWEACHNAKFGCLYMRKTSGGVKHKCKLSTDEKEIFSRASTKEDIDDFRLTQAMMASLTNLSPTMMQNWAYSQVIEKAVKFGAMNGYNALDIEDMIPTRNTV